jgi:ribosomal protein RSM22 (predicted rRNA methylase)
MVHVGKQVLPDAIWRTSKFEEIAELPVHDVVVCSYALGEGRSDTLLVEKAWKAAGQLLILIEPGTPRGFSWILGARTRLIELGASILAPCPTAAQCPAQRSGLVPFLCATESKCPAPAVEGGDAWVRR